MAVSKTGKRQGLMLNLGGAPCAPHTVVGWPGLYRPDVPTPVGGKGDLFTLDQARQRLASWEADVNAAQTAWEADEQARAKDPTHVRNVAEPFDRPEPPLVLVDIDDIKSAETTRDHDLATARNAVAQARREARTTRRPNAGDTEQIDDAAKAVAGQESD